MRLAVGEPLFGELHRCAEIAGFAHQFLHCGDNHVGDDIIGLVAEVADPQQFRSGNVARQAARVNIGQHDVVAVAADDDRGCGDLLISWGDLGDVGVQIGDIDGVVAEGEGRSTRCGAVLSM